jgi:transcriptional regulator with PAS, ATPase and Fis domain
MADGGTLFLDEVAEMSLKLQVKLLRYLQEQSFERVGSLKKIFINTRIIAATNKDLNEKVKDGSFREDLYYRLAVFPVNIPPLRERKEDIPSLTSHFIDKYQKDFDRKISFVSPESMEVLTNYFWPGNVRQLENVIYHAMIMAESECIDLQSLPDSIKGKIEIETLPSTSHLSERDSKNTIDTFDESIKQVLQKALDLTNGDIPKTAKKLKISRSSFYRMVQKYGLTKTVSKFEPK